MSNPTHPGSADALRKALRCGGILSEGGQIVCVYCRQRALGTHDIRHADNCTLIAAIVALSADAALSQQGVVETPPFEPTEEMWGGLARQIVLWDRFNDRSGYTLHRNLKATGHEVPEWLAKEIPATTQVPPKGTVAACIWKAMYLAHKPAALQAQVTGEALSRT